jgi:cell wall-associated NlpC family hydrolase
MRSFLGRSVLVTVMAAAVLIQAPAAFAYTDVPTNHWDYAAIKYISIDRPYMRDYGTTTFRPGTVERRNYMARTLVQMYAPDEPTDPRITFPDLATTSTFYRYANVAVKLGWIKRKTGGMWDGTGPVVKNVMDQAIVLALGLKEQANGLQRIHQDDGDPYHVAGRFSYLAIGASLGLHYNHSDESMDLGATTPMRRDEVAYTFWIARTLPSWKLSSLDPFTHIALPTLDEATAGGKVQQQFTQYALRQVGYPYIWGGEWNSRSPSGYCCGYQPQGGMDCSGFMWFVLKKNEDGYNAAQFRAYPGWSLHDRTSSTMAEHAPVRIRFADLKIGNLMFFASNGGGAWQDVDHVGLYIGNDWMVHSTSGGPQLAWVGDGWYQDHFVWGRGLRSSSSAPALSATAALGGEPAVAPGP